MRRWFKWRPLKLPAEFFKILNAKDGWIKVLKQSHFSLEIVTRLSIKQDQAQTNLHPRVRPAVKANVRKSRERFRQTFACGEKQQTFSGDVSD